jgi:hypothetical protein
MRVYFLFALHICVTKNQSIMKQRFVLSLLFVCSFVITTRAQIKKGAVWLGGSVGYNQYKDDPVDTAVHDFKNNTLSISPAVGFAVKDNLVVGIRLTYAHTKTDNNGTYLESKGDNYGGGIFIRQYIPVVNRLYLFGEAAAAYISTKQTDTYNQFYNGNYVKSHTTTKGWNAGVSITPGVAFAVTKKFQLETSLNSLLGVTYSKNKITAERPATGTNKTISQFNAGIFTDSKVQFNIGCRFLINNKG